VTGVRSAGLPKAAVRALSRELGLVTAGKPAAACLSSRIADGDPVSPELLGRIEQAEEALHQAGFLVCRVRAHAAGSVARIEVPPEDLGRLLDRREEITGLVRAAGFVFATADLAGLRSGHGNDQQGRKPDRASLTEQDRSRGDHQLTAASSNAA